MSQSIEHLPHKHENLGLMPRTHENNVGMEVRVCDPSTGEEADGTPGLVGQLAHST